jgi:hypothetical protein
MKISRKLVLVSTLAISGSVAVLGSSAQAATQHCDGKNDPGKVELAYEATTVQTSFTYGTVCIKAGNVVFADVHVGSDGTITAPNGKGISYYVCDSPYGCDGDSEPES